MRQSLLCGFHWRHELRLQLFREHEWTTNKHGAKAGMVNISVSSFEGLLIGGESAHTVLLFESNGLSAVH